MAMTTRPGVAADLAEGHAPGTTYAKCPAMLPQAAHPAVPMHERSCDPAAVGFPCSREIANAPDMPRYGCPKMPHVSSEVSGQAGAGACHRALTGMARSLSPNGSVEVPV